MNKLFLSLAASTLALGASAQDFTDFFTLTFEGEPIENGATIYATDYEEYEGYGVSYNPHIKMVNKDLEPRQCTASLLYTGNPSVAMVNEDFQKWGNASLCYSGGADGFEISAQSCLGGGSDFAVASGNVIVPGAGTDTFQWEPHLEFAAADTESSYKLMLVAMEGYEDEAEETGNPFSLTLVFTTNKNATVAPLVTSDNAVKYYDLQGVETPNPEKGLFIRVENGKAVKIAL